MLLQALSNFLAGPEGSIVHIAHEPLTGKNGFLMQLIMQITEINPQMQYFYCDSNTNIFKRLISHYSKQVFHSKIKDSESLVKILTPMQNASIFHRQVVIIDCLTDLFRNNRGESFGEYKMATEIFASDILNRINLISIKNNVHFILIHQTSYRPQLDCQLPVEQDLMNIAKGIWVMLTKNMIGDKEGQAIYRYNAHLSYEFRQQSIVKNFAYDLIPHFHFLPLAPLPIEESEES